MTVTELERHSTASESVAVYRAGKLTVRLVSTFGGKAKLDELLYTRAAQKLADKIGKDAASL